MNFIYELPTARQSLQRDGEEGARGSQGPSTALRNPAATEGADGSRGRQSRAEPGPQRAGGGAGGRAGREGADRARRRAGGPGRTRPHQRSSACSRRRPSWVRHPRAPLGGRRGGGRGGGGSGGGARNREAAAARRGREGASRSRAGPCKSNSDASSSSSASVSPLRRPERLLAAQPGCRLRPGRAAEVPGERPAPWAGHCGLHWVSVPGATGALPPLFSLLPSPGGRRWRAGDGDGAILSLPASLLPSLGLLSLCLRGAPSSRRRQALRRQRGCGAACMVAGGEQPGRAVGPLHNPCLAGGAAADLPTALRPPPPGRCSSAPAAALCRGWGAAELVCFLSPSTRLHF